MKNSSAATCWVRRVGYPEFHSGVAHFGPECPPGWVSAAIPMREVVLTDDREALPTVPDDLVQALQAYGDARADGDIAASAARLFDCILQVRRLVGAHDE